MLFIIAGGDSRERAERRRAIARGVEELDRRTITIEELAAIAGTLTLTGASQSFFIRSAFVSTAEGADKEEAEDFRSNLLDIAEGLVESPHTFIFEEEKPPLKAILERLKKAGATIELLAAKEKKESFNVFALSNALGKRDRKTLWILLMQALREGLAPENIAGVLSWKARTMLASARTPREKEILEKTSRDLICMYHDAHRGMGDLALLLERFALTL